MKTGGQLIVDALEATCTDRIFASPGESYLAVSDGCILGDPHHPLPPGRRELR